MGGQIYLYDGSFEGLLTAVAVAVKAIEPVKGVYGRQKYVPRLFDHVTTIESDSNQAKRLFDYLHSISASASHLAMQAFFSEEKKAANYLLQFVKLCLARGVDALSLHTDDAVRELFALSRKVGFEAHRLNGLLRFRVLSDGMLYAPYESDHNVISHCAGHFQKRFSNKQWMLHDLGRNFALYWDTKSLQPVDVDGQLTEYTKRVGELPDVHLTEEEKQYQHLWRTFHSSIANPGRENKVLQRSFMPQRYWHFLIEMKS